MSVLSSGESRQEVTTPNRLSVVVVAAAMLVPPGIKSGHNSIETEAGLVGGVCEHECYRNHRSGDMLSPLPERTVISYMSELRRTDNPPGPAGSFIENEGLHPSE